MIKNLSSAKYYIFNEKNFSFPLLTVRFSLISNNFKNVRKYNQYYCTVYSYIIKNNKNLKKPESKA